ncbi:MAG: hypothetical protein HZC49_11150 [Nitrospirae bacterium]|nr:hypothetical protein [Nitrospirota bacterium]
MSKGKLKASYLILIISAIMIVAGCGGGGGGGGSSSSTVDPGVASALTVAEQVSVVEAQGETSKSAAKVAALSMGVLNLTPSDVPADSDYNNDRQEVYVHERSAEAFSIVNEILCAMAQTKYDVMMNQGDYKAQIDMNQCSKDKDSASSAGESSQNQSSGSTAPDYEMWTVNSSRADGASPHIVKVWIHEEAEQDRPAMVIFVKVTITEGKSDTNPYGIFGLNFVGHPVIDGVVNTSVAAFKGILKTELDSSGQVLLKFANEGNEGGQFTEKTVLNRASDGSTGSGSVYTLDSWGGQPQETSFNIAFNTTYFLRAKADNSDPKCFSRTSFDETAWDYGLYGADGSRVSRNSGFPIKKDNYYGWIGYYGLWLPNEANVNNGDTVYKVSFGQGGETAVPYTVVKKGGRLKKHTRNTITLGAIKNVPLDFWNDGDSNRVKWNGTNFVKFAQMNQQTHMWENIQESNLSLNNMNHGDLNFWSQSLGGQVRVKLVCTWTPGEGQTPGSYSCNNPADNTPVIFYKEDVVFPGDTVPSPLRCYDNCPKYTEGVTGIASLDPTYPPDYDPSNGMTEHNYTFVATADDMLLRDGGGALTWVNNGGEGQNQWGLMSGPLFDPSESNINALDCNWDGDGDPATDPHTCGWKTHGELSVFYTWETGPNQWNQFTVLKDANGTALEFEAPLQLQYVHAQTDTNAYDYKYNGVSFFLDYSGFGNLHGIPGACIDKDTGAPVNCGPDTRWVPEFTIADGSDCSDGNANEYLIKALRKEQRMQNVDIGNCSTLSLTSYALPSVDLWVDPAIGDEPVVANAPAVIGGVVQ